jgi:hypothetical protein
MVSQTSLKLFMLVVCDESSTKQALAAGCFSLSRFLHVEKKL